MAITVDTNHGPGSLNIPEGARNKSHPLNRCPGTSSEGWHQLSERHFRRQNSNHRIYEWLEIRCNNVLAPRLVDEVGNASCRTLEQSCKGNLFCTEDSKRGSVIRGTILASRHYNEGKWTSSAGNPSPELAKMETTGASPSTTRRGVRRWGVNEGK